MVVIFGRTGVGISSLVNLISGYPISKNHSKARTPKIRPHLISLPSSDKEFRLYEVPGFGGPIQDAKILKTIRQIERDVGIDLFICCFRQQKATILPDIVRRIRDSAPGKRVPMIAVVTGLELFKPGMDEWWNVALDDGATNGTMVERICFGEDDRFDAHACITTLPQDKVGLLEVLRKRRDLSEDRIRRLILEHCGPPGRSTVASPQRDGVGHGRSNVREAEHDKSRQDPPPVPDIVKPSPSIIVRPAFFPRFPFFIYTLHTRSCVFVLTALCSMRGNTIILQMRKIY